MEDFIEQIVHVITVLLHLFESLATLSVGMHPDDHAAVITGIIAMLAVMIQ